jgi:hypothetical protein
MQARVLTQQQADSLFEVPYNSQDSRFWVREHEDGSLCITEDCVELANFPSHQWLKECPLIDFVPKTYPLPI